MANLLDNLDGIPGANRIRNNSANAYQARPVDRAYDGANGSSPNKSHTNKTLYVKCISGEYNGKRIGVMDGETITFGRSPKNHIVFKEEERGVSRLHLSLTANVSERKVTLIDLDSSYGTYDATKRRYVSNYPYELSEGDVFTFGYNQMFKIEFE